MREAVSNSWMWEVLRDTPFGEFIKKANWYYKLNLEATKTSVGGYQAEFLTNSRSEYSRVKSFVGETRILERILDRLDGNEQYWDVGANIGTHSVFPAKKLTSGHVTAFEPMPAVNERLKTNLSKNSPQERWTVEQMALYSETGETTMQTGSDDPGSGTHSISAEGNLVVNLQRADEYINANDSPDVVKIDVEGAELEVLKGFGKHLSDIKLFIVEIHPTELEKYDGTQGQVLNRLDRAGFEIQERIKREPSGDTYHAIFEQS